MVAKKTEKAWFWSGITTGFLQERNKMPFRICGSSLVLGYNTWTVKSNWGYSKILGIYNYEQLVSALQDKMHNLVFRATVSETSRISIIVQFENKGGKHEEFFQVRRKSYNTREKGDIYYQAKSNTERHFKSPLVSLNRDLNEHLKRKTRGC